MNYVAEVESLPMTSDLVSTTFALLIENGLDKVACPIQNMLAQQALVAWGANWTGTKICVFQRYIGIKTFISHSLMSDIDECAEQVDPCATLRKTECKNTNGSYECQCIGGFVMEARSCEGIMQFCTIGNTRYFQLA